MWAAGWEAVVSSAPEYKDLDRLRLEYYVKHTRLTTAEIAQRMGRTRGAVARKMQMMGMTMRQDRYGKESPWHAR